MVDRIELARSYVQEWLQKRSDIVADLKREQDEIIREAAEREDGSA